VKTSESLLARVKNLDDAESWRRFVEIYEPLLYRYARLRGLSREDANEVKQDCLTQLVRVMPEFEYEPHRGKFKSWLYCVANNKIRDLYKRRKPSTRKNEELDVESKQASMDDLWNHAWELKHLRYCLARVLKKTQPGTRRAFELYVIAEWTPERVASTLRMSVDQVYAAKSRIVQRVRRLMNELPGQT